MDTSLLSVLLCYGEYVRWSYPIGLRFEQNPTITIQGTVIVGTVGCVGVKLAHRRVAMERWFLQMRMDGGMCGWYGSWLLLLLLLLLSFLDDWCKKRV
jgi:hypothetical protein